MQAIVLADGDVPSRARLDAVWPGWSTPDAIVVAADGGARHAAGLGLRIDIWAGDGDSIDPGLLASLAADGVDVRRYPADKDASDTELAVGAAIEGGADSVVILGGLGGPRLDHGLANIGLLALPALRRRPSVILDATTRVTALFAPGEDGEAARRRLDGPVGDGVSLLPMGDGVEGVTTSGLAYPLADEALSAGPARGLSNLRTSPDAWVSLRRGGLLIIETAATLRR